MSLKDDSTHWAAHHRYADISCVMHLSLTEASRKLRMSRKTLYSRWKSATGGRMWPSRQIMKTDKQILTLLHNIPRNNTRSLSPYVGDTSVKTGHLKNYDLIKIRQWISENRKDGDHGHKNSYCVKSEPTNDSQIESADMEYKTVSKRVEEENTICIEYLDRLVQYRRSLIRPVIIRCD